MSDPGFNIPTNRGDMSADSLLGELLYAGYLYNREAAPHITPQQWAQIYPMVTELEARYQAEKAISKAAA